MIRKPTDLSQVSLYSGLEGAIVKGVEIMDGSIGEANLIFDFPLPYLFFCILNVIHIVNLMLTTENDE